MYNYEAELSSLSVGIVPRAVTLSALPALGSTGSSSFDADQVWGDVIEASKVSGYKLVADSLCPGDDAQEEAQCAGANAAIANANFRGGRAADNIRDGLRTLGYSPGMNATAWGGADKTAWKAFAADQNVPAGPGLVSKPGLDRMEQLLSGGGGGGGGGGKTVAGIPWWGWALGAAGVVGVIAVASR